MKDDLFYIHFLDQESGEKRNQEEQQILNSIASGYGFLDVRITWILRYVLYKDFKESALQK